MNTKKLRRLALIPPTLLAVVLGATPAASAGCGGNVFLGVLNACDGTTQLRGSLNGRLFTVTNTNTGASAGGLRAMVNSPGTALFGSNAGAGPAMVGTSVSGTGIL